jgi:hypothetical protein
MHTQVNKTGRTPHRDREVESHGNVEGMRGGESLNAKVYVAGRPTLGDQHH